MSNHTPGPWRIGKNFGSVVCDTPVLGIRGSDHTEYYGGHLIAESVTKANARLIALSPTMFDALRQWAWAEAHGDSAEIENARKARDAAIAKARGEK